MTATPAPKVGFVSLGCPKALVDSERILTQLRAEGYQTAPDYDDAQVVIVNTCGFIDSAVEESLEAIGEAMAENGKVIVTGCMGVGSHRDRIREKFPDVLSISGPQDFASVMTALHTALPPQHDPFLDLVPPQGVKLTPRHYAYLKISEGCNHQCSFCIIPGMRGRLVSRPVDAVLREGERLVQAGVKELLVISQDTSAYGVDLKYAPGTWQGREYRARLKDLCEGLGSLDAWVRLHYVYPYPHVDDIIPLMAEGRLLPYLDIPFQHGAPSVLKRMKRPAAAENTLERIRAWRAVCPDITLRSTFIVGFPGETEAEFQTLLDWLEEAQLDRVGCFTYSAVEGATANALPDPVPEAVKQERQARFMEAQARISAARLQAKVGREIDVLVDGFDEDGYLVGRSQADAPEIDGKVYLSTSLELEAGDIVRCEVIAADEHDLNAEVIG
ncbi:30S ribosomal protein S12 methylthiotransferase RimO [Flagellatimonas centrodinii]|uniref:30S ribosomal protein S12 methylthiotransferase RimO n=1 Tax=Flagellatimonas centrodinii TaxID=2806210 RepID=UPI001FEE4BAE|nr:30S ribosomal protein S12 methylthiotransferase RimO [Flagellatimonas centrodinii]ULQ47209.1 30S ribosomal protein S12 methylthiotransferase RimO [Flagellatimonas centrodinii]